MLVRSTIANWRRPERPPDPPPEPWQLAGGPLRGEQPSCFRAGSGSIWEIEPQRFVAHMLPNDEQGAAVEAPVCLSAQIAA
jgi:hypothetical protein